MKKLLLAALLVTLSVATYAQGTVNFSNYGQVARRVNYSSVEADYNDNATYTALHGTAAEVNQYTVGLLYQRAGDTSYSLYDTTTPIGYNNKAGYFNAGTATIPGTKGGDVVSLQLQVWQSSVASYDAALTTPGAFSGISAAFDTTLGGGSTPAASLAFTAFPLVQTPGPIVPEPTTVALGLFGVVGLFLARRRK